ncbi:calcium/sodium antiporter [Saliphagus sp. GCM10025317]
MSLLGPAASTLVGLVALWLGARWLVTAASRLARAAGIPPLIVGLTVVAFGTSAPEIVVGVEAALEGRGAIAVGNVVGSNAFNLGAILGTLAIISPFRVADTLVRRDAVAMAAATGVGIAVLVNLYVSRTEGLILLACLVIYMSWLARSARGSDVDVGEAERSGTNRHPGVDALVLVVGLVLVGLGGRLLVQGAVELARAGGVSEWLIGVTVVAGGTSLPEAAASVVAARRAEVGIAAGNVVGSNVFNLLGVLGISAMAAPLAVDLSVRSGLWWLAALTAVSAVLLATGRRLTRLEGVALVLSVAGYWVLAAG